VAKSKFSVVQNVRISKSNMMFAKSGIKNFSTEIFRIAKLTDRRSRSVHELEDLKKTPIKGIFYQVEGTPFRVSKQTA